MPTGPIPAPYMLIGEAPGYGEVQSGLVFSGPSGRELDRMLHEAGIERANCYCDNILAEPLGPADASDLIWRKKNPPLIFQPLHTAYADRAVLAGIERLKGAIRLVRPRVLVLCGNLALFAFTGRWGVTSWRGSRLEPPPELAALGVAWIVPTYNPAAILRQWGLRADMVRDLRRAAALYSGAQVPVEGKYTIPGTPEEALGVLATLTARAESAGSDSHLYLSVDIETRGGQIACTGIAWSRTEAICTPHLVASAPFFWTDPDTEAILLVAMKRLLTHPRVRVIGQNFLYDAQYFIRRFRFMPNIWFDTMIGHHATFNTLPKGLDYLSAMYAEDHVYWKDESKEWDPAIGERQLWIYNCKDACITYEVAFEIISTAHQLGTSDNVEFQHSMFLPALWAMVHGYPIDKANRAAFATRLLTEISKREAEINQIVGHPLNPRSSDQLARFFYTDLGIQPVKSRKTGSVSTDKEALKTIERKEPLTSPIIRRIEAIRSLGVYNSTFVLAGLDADGRIRCSFNVAGTITYRWSSSKNAFGSGTNLQNLPKGKEMDDGELELPNIRTLFVPPPGYTAFDMDLDRADLQVVVWEADDAELRLALRLGVDMHIFNASALFNFSVVPEELVESHPNYPEHKARWAKQRQLAKSWVHGTNYGGSPRTMAIAAGITVREAERLQNTWFGAHPGIKSWHRRTEQMIESGCVSNIFGAKWYIFDRPDNILPEALAWQPQSVVSRVINTAMRRVHDLEPAIIIPLQVHDSIAGFFPTYDAERCMARLRELSKVTIPYSEPLIIPTGIKTSTISWGDCA